MSKIRPLHERVLVRRLEEKEISKGGIIIPDSAKEKPAEGEIIAAGKGKSLKAERFFPSTLKSGTKFFSANIQVPM